MEVPTASGLVRHFGQCHRGDRETYIKKLEVTLLDRCQEEKDLKRLEYKWICNLGTFFGVGLNSRNGSGQQQKCWCIIVPVKNVGAS